MFLKNIESTVNLLTCSYKELLSFENSFLFSDEIFDELLSKKFFFSQWTKKFNHSISKNKSDYKYWILNSSNKYLKVKLSIKNSFFINKILCASIDDFLIIIEKHFLKYKVILLIKKEENPKLYDHILQNNLNSIDSADFIYQKDQWLNNISSIKSLYTDFLNLSYANKTALNYPSTFRNSFNISKACSYAEKFALTYNPDYKHFDKNGGDCTNYISQILYEGGINRSSIWTPYSNAWLRVQELYNYLISSKKGFKLPPDSPLDKGMVIQFFRPEIGYFFHSGFITHALDNGDFLYCCHSYDKLNYPLSYIYPIIYPTLRAIYF